MPHLTSKPRLALEKYLAIIQSDRKPIHTETLHMWVEGEKTEVQKCNLVGASREMDPLRRRLLKVKSRTLTSVMVMID